MVRTGTWRKVPPIVSVLGPPQDLGGQISDRIDGFKTSVSCGSKEKRFVEVLTVVRVGDGGAAFSGIDVTYSVAGKTFKLKSDWVYELCGERVDMDGC